MRLIPYRHPNLGWYFNWKLVYMVDGALYIGNLAFKWNDAQPLRLRPVTKKGRVWGDGDVEPDMYIWLKFNISLSRGWGIGLTYK